MNDSKYSISSASQIVASLGSCAAANGNSVSDCYSGFAASLGGSDCSKCVSIYFSGNIGASSCISRCSRSGGCGGCDTSLTANLIKVCSLAG